MANDIVPSSAGWATSQMKPDTDEEGNSLWSKNIADNTGYLFNLVNVTKRETFLNFPTWFDSINGGQYGILGTADTNAGTYTLLQLDIYKNAVRGTLYYNFQAQRISSGAGSIHVQWRGTVNKIHPITSIGFLFFTGTIPMDAGTDGPNTLSFVAKTAGAGIHTKYVNIESSL